MVKSTFPMGLDPSGRAVLLYIVTALWTDEFRTFLQDHAGGLRVVPSWTLRLVFPRPLDRAYGAYQTVVREERPSTAPRLANSSGTSNTVNRPSAKVFTLRPRPSSIAPRRCSRGSRCCTDDG
jgi:hypothetical protein